MTDQTIELLIRPSGNVKMIYTESLDGQLFGQVTIRRASHVEPGPDGQWTADLSPVGGPVLGPFAFRSQALDAEVEWLRRYWL
jgi:hypothetical protein